MIRLIFIELLNSKCQRKDGKQYIFTQPHFVSVVVQAFLESEEKSLFRVFTLDIEDNELLEVQETARQNDTLVDIELETVNGINYQWIFENLEYYY